MKSVHKKTIKKSKTMTRTESFSDLVLKASKSLKLSALRYTKDNDDAQDLIQETILKALLNKDKFEKGTNINAWLFIIMKNIYMTIYKSKKKQAVVDTSLEFFENIKNDDYTDSLIIMKEATNIINDIDEIFRKPFLMHYQGYKYDEISKKLDIPMGTVKNRIYIAKKMCASKLKR